MSIPITYPADPNADADGPSAVYRTQAGHMVYRTRPGYMIQVPTRRRGDPTLFLHVTDEGLLTNGCGTAATPAAAVLAEVILCCVGLRPLAGRVHLPASQ